MTLECPMYMWMCVCYLGDKDRHLVAVERIRVITINIYHSHVDYKCSFFQRVEKKRSINVQFYQNKVFSQAPKGTSGVR